MSDERLPETLMPEGAPDPSDVPVDGSTGAAPAEQGAPVDGAPVAPPTAVAAGRDGLAEGELLAVLAGLFPDERPVLHWLGRRRAAGAVAAGRPAALAECLEGRAWGAQAELRWRRTGAADWTALYLGTSASCPDSFAVLADDLREVEAPALRPWGQRGDDGLYRAERLGTALAYPGLATQAGEAVMPCSHLVDRQGVVRFVRLALREDE